MINEIINYDKFTKLEYNKNFFNNRKIIFTIFVDVEKVSDVNINTIYSVLNQTLTSFEFVFLVKKNNKKNLEKFFETNKLNDSRIKIITESLNDFKEKAKYSPTLFCVQVYFDTFLERTFLETIYVNYNINKSVDVFFTNVISIEDKKNYNKALIHKKRKVINLFSKVIAYKKELIDDILNDNYNNKSIMHLDFYGVYEKKCQDKIIRVSRDFINYPKSCLYNYNSEPHNINFTYDCQIYKQTILCILPWAKIGGADMFNLNVIKYLKNNGYNIIVVTTEICPYEARDSFEEFVDAYYDLTTFLPREYWTDFIYNIIKNYNVKLIFQMSSVYGYHVIPWIKCKFPQLPIIDYLHAEDFAWRNGGYPKDSTSVEQFLDKTYTCNKHLMDLMIEKMGRSNKNIETLYIGVDTDLYNPEKIKVEDKKTAEFCKNKKVILFPSRFSYEKRPLFLLNVIKKIKEERNDIVCVMVGGGPADNDIINYIEKNKLNDMVKVLQLKKEIKQYYKLADVVVICSLSEGITLTTYEALSMDVPVITADVGGQKEIVNDKCGKVIKTFQDIKKDLYNFNYSPEEIELYKNSIYKIIENKYPVNQCRNIIINNYSQKKLFNTIENNISQLIKTKSNNKNLINENFAIRYLVLYNESSKLFFYNSFEYDEFKEYIKNKLWTHWWYRGAIKIGKKLKVDKLLKKVYFKNR